MKKRTLRFILTDLTRRLKGWVILKLGGHVKPVIRVVNRYDPPQFNFVGVSYTDLEKELNRMMTALRASSMGGNERFPRPLVEPLQVRYRWPAVDLIQDVGFWTVSWDFTRWGSEIVGHAEGQFADVLPHVLSFAQFHPDMVRDWAKRAMSGYPSDYTPTPEKMSSRPPNVKDLTALPEVVGVEGPGVKGITCREPLQPASWETLLEFGLTEAEPLLPGPNEIPWGKYRLTFK